MNTNPKQNTAQSELILSPFITLVADAINFCHLAENPSFTRSARSSMVRASILNVVFAIECAANSLLKHLDLPKNMYNQFERLSTLDKYETMLFLSSPDAIFDRGSIEIQSVQELIKIRNSQVHVRSKQHNVTGKPINEAWWVFEANNEKSSVLSIPYNSDFWESEHSINALHALDHFIELYFINYSGYTPEHITAILFSTVIHNNKGTILLNEDCVEAIDLAKDNFGLHFRYVSVEKPEVRVSVVKKDFMDHVTKT